MNCISPTWYLVLLQGVLRILITEGTSGVLMWQWFFHAVWVLSSSRPLCQDRGDHIKKVREDSLFPLHRGRSETWRHSPGWPVLGLGEALQCSSPQATSSPAPAKVRWQQQCWGTCLRVVWPLRTLSCPSPGRNGSFLTWLRDACTVMWCWRTYNLTGFLQWRGEIEASFEQSVSVAVAQARTSKESSSQETHLCEVCGPVLRDIVSQAWAAGNTTEV